MGSVMVGEQPLTVIERSRGWAALHLKEIWDYRELLLFLTWRDIKVRYKQTVIGAAWAIIQPVFSMVVFSVLFGRLAKFPSDGVPYPLFTYTALLPWQCPATPGNRYVLPRTRRACARRAPTLMLSTCTTQVGSDLFRFAVEEVVGRVTHEQLVTHIGRGQAAGIVSRRRSPSGIQTLDEGGLAQEVTARRPILRRLGPQ
jgi:hypothetical protein